MSEYYDTVPVVFVVRLGFATVGLDGEAVGADAVLVGENVGYGLSTTLREFHIVSCGTGVLVGIALYDYVNFGISLHPFGYVVNVDHFFVGNHCRVDLESNS